MKTFRLKIITLSFVSVFLSSCTTLMFTSLDVLRPAKIAFVPEANNLLIVNNTITQPAEYGHKIQLLNERAKKVTLPTDSLSIFCLGALKEELDGKNFFSTIQLLPNTLNSGSDFNNISRLNAGNVKNLCKSQQADVILSLDKITVNDDLIEYYVNESSTFLSTLDVKFETFWSVQYPNNPKITSVQFKDTIYWESESYYRKKAMSDIPNRSDALIDGSLYVGQKTINRFIPYWDKVDRYLFKSNNKLMKQGLDSVYVKNWTSAIENWEKAIKNTKSTKVQAQAQNNIAVAYEIIGNMDKASDYAAKSYYSFSKIPIDEFSSYSRLIDYMNELEQRKSEISVLKKQLGEK